MTIKTHLQRLAICQLRRFHSDVYFWEMAIFFYERIWKYSYRLWKSFLLCKGCMKASLVGRVNAVAMATDFCVDTATIFTFVVQLFFFICRACVWLSSFVSATVKCCKSCAKKSSATPPHVKSAFTIVDSVHDPNNRWRPSCDSNDVF